MELDDNNDIIYTQYSPDLGRLVNFIHRLFGGNETNLDSFLATLARFWDIFSILAFLLSALFIFGTIRAYIMINKYGAKTAESISAAEDMWKHKHNGLRSGNQRWVEVQEHVKSDRPNDWKRSSGC